MESNLQSLISKSGTPMDFLWALDGFPCDPLWMPQGILIISYGCPMHYPLVISVVFVLVPYECLLDYPWIHYAWF